jgi:acetaldehyde dehydrogenase (acetylating)
MKFALEKPAFRILVNTQAALGAVGYTTGLEPSMTLGPGTQGGSIISDNVTARHLMNVKRLAFETNPINPDTTTQIQEKTPVTAHAASVPSSWMEEIDKRIVMKAGNTPVWKKEAVPATSSTKTFGTGLSADEVDKLAESFSKKLK